MARLEPVRGSKKARASRVFAQAWRKRERDGNCLSGEEDLSGNILSPDEMIVTALASQ